MARKRMLSPEMFTSSTVSAWPPSSRWTWAGLLCYVDDDGYGADKPALVRAAVWPDDEAHPYSIQDVAADLDRFAEDGSLCRFICCDLPQMHIPSWLSWQRVDHPGKPRHCVCTKHSGDVREDHAKESRARHERLALMQVNPDKENFSGDDGLANFHTVRQQLASRSEPGQT